MPTFMALSGHPALEGSSDKTQSVKLSYSPSDVILVACRVMGSFFLVSTEDWGLNSGVPEDKYPKQK